MKDHQLDVLSFPRLLVIHNSGWADCGGRRAMLQSEFWRMSKRISGSDLECTDSMLSDHFNHTMSCQKQIALGNASFLAALEPPVPTLGKVLSQHCWHFRLRLGTLQTLAQSDVQMKREKGERQKVKTKKGIKYCGVSFALSLPLGPLGFPNVCTYNTRGHSRTLYK